MNKKINNIWLPLVWAACIALASCNKSDVVPGTASLSIFNGLVGSQSLIINYAADQPLIYFSSASKINYGTFNSAYKLNSFSGERYLALYNYPDTAGNPIKELKLNLPLGSVHSLYVTGTLDAPDTVFIEEHLPYYGTDSIAGIRFVNLSPVGSAISVNLLGEDAGSEVAHLGYKEVSGFIPYPADATIFNYVFEFRDAGSGELLTTYMARDVGQPGFDWLPNPWMFKNNTLALIGIPGDLTTPSSITVIQNY